MTPMFYLHTVPGLQNIILLTGNLLLIIGVAYLIQRDFRAPYFQILNRTWRGENSRPIYHTVIIDEEPRIMSDLFSDGRCMTSIPPRAAPGGIVALSFESNTLNIECWVRS